MEMQFQKNSVSYLKTLLHQQQKQEQTQQVRLTDAMPDIGRILGCWGQVLVRGKEWHGDSVSASGGVMAWVLYASEGEGKLCCADAWLPFQMKWEVEDVQRDGIMEIRTMLCYIDARMISDRKLVVRANIGAQLQAWLPESAAIYTPMEIPADVQVLRQVYPMMLPAEAGEKTFDIAQTLEIPQDGARVHKLVHYSARPELTEYKIVADKLVLRGSADIYALYMDEAGKLHRHSWQVPFSQYTQLDSEYAPNAEARVCFELTQLEMEITQPDAMELKLGFTAQYTIVAPMEVAVTEDMYSVSREVRPDCQEVRLPSVLRSVEQNIRAEAQAPEGQVLDVAFAPELPQVLRNENEAVTELEGMFQILYTDENGEVQCATERWQKSVPETAARSAEYLVTISRASQPEPDMGISADIRWEAQTVSGAAMEQITAAELGDVIPKDPQRPSLILRRAGTDSLWEIAKENRSTVDAIKRANGLQQEPPAEQMLLIPVS